MTIRACISGAASKWQTPQSPEYHFSSDPCFRVPPTGIPKPEPDEVPQAHRWRDRLAGFACAMVLAFGAGNMANASSSGGLDWKPDSPVSANMAGKPSGSGAELLPRMDDWLPAANISTGQQSASQLDGARQDGNGQAEERKVASSTILQKEPVTGDGQAATIPEVAFTKSPDEPVITAGMPLQVDILGGKRTVMNYIMTPIQKSLATAFREK